LLRQRCAKASAASPIAEPVLRPPAHPRTSTPCWATTRRATKRAPGLLSRVDNDDPPPAIPNRY
jgi:hypothetical protein